MQNFFIFLSLNLIKLDFTCKYLSFNLFLILNLFIQRQRRFTQQIQACKIKNKTMDNLINIAKQFIYSNLSNLQKSTKTKKDQLSSFYIPMGSYFGAEICDLVGLYILDRLGKTYMSNKICL